MTHNIVVVHELYPELLTTLQADYHVTHFQRLASDDDRQAFREAMAEADAFIGSNVKFDKALLDGAPRLKVIASVSVGVDAYPLDEIRARNIVLTNTPEVLTDATADTGFLLLMMAARRAGEMERKVRGGQWQASLGRADFGIDITGKTLGVVGMGRIGQAVAQRGHHGFNMPVVFYNRSDKPELEDTFDARQVSLETLFSESDFIVVTVALSEDTRGLIDRRLLAATRDKAILINISRGQVVREDDLIACLQDGTLYYAGLDVYEREPLASDSALLSLDNAVLLPHIGSSTFETRNAMCDLAADNLNRVLGGEPALTSV
ncbi:2-hydroxyacid dehydrogenase [Kushneria indalinina]|uniref:Glyoxylate/hydroxypyruvate reductase B n=1 Tax=Kushneria indalinina DSM 14324 TaxID=1122140 RepID=A0A3D9E0B7_9GAMM|nr:D-glycerate dehydrogenase [Kushneria indalinina]REC96451.1 phosphogluconate 2-dehydrogenase [Kushneria indalinina DSM 14324]